MTRQQVKKKQALRKRNLAFLAFTIAVIIAIVPIILEIPPISYMFYGETLFLIWVVAVAMAFCFAYIGLLLLRASGCLFNPLRYPTNLFVAVVVIFAFGLAAMVWSYQWSTVCPHIGPSCFSSFIVLVNVFFLNIVAAVLALVGMYEMGRMPLQVSHSPLKIS